MHAALGDIFTFRGRLRHNWIRLNRSQMSHAREEKDFSHLHQSQDVRTGASRRVSMTTTLHHRATHTLPHDGVQPACEYQSWETFRVSGLPGASVAGWEWRRKWLLEARSSPGNRLHDAEILMQTHGGQMRREQSASSHRGPKYSSDTPTFEE